MGKRKFNYYELKQGRKAWRSQVDFQNDFFCSDDDKSATRKEIEAFLGFTKKYDSYVNQMNIKGERNRFSFKEYRSKIGDIYVKGVSFDIKERTQSFLRRKAEKIEEKLNEYMTKTFGGLVILNNTFFLNVVVTDDDIIVIPEESEFYRKLTYWKYDNINKRWGWEDSTTPLTKLYPEDDFWAKELSLLDVVKSFGIQNAEEVVRNITTLTVDDINAKIIEWMGGEEDIKKEVLSMIPEGDRSLWMEEKLRAEESEKKRVESLGDDADIATTFRKAFRFS